ncbi:transmembrane protein 214-A-like [Topomyia yanbarensis]|uniref:transmembrane protein 214-A-like n=1 Tax=Topomyia yanbarensis TaxID=2498891 RepID=UPI00273C3A21|nr:transmembrane protein 214-A-like [Topomyia yanbarensis]XP_058815685.1 transmembrane protein 214-A-like [Topomyia yanbarensis]
MNSEMTNEWEVVGKQKKPRKTGGDKINGIAASKGGILKIEDADTMDQIRSLYANVKDDVLFDSKQVTGERKNNHNTNGKQQSHDRKRSPGRGQQQQNQNKNKQKIEAERKQQAKPKYKDIEAALKAIIISDLRAHLWAVNESFKDNHLLLLKAITAFLNEHLRVENVDPIFADKSLSYPYSVIPHELKAIIDQSISSASTQILQFFYDLSLSNLAEDMNKNLPHMGHKILLQAVALHQPQICVNNLARNAIIRNSFQNRSNIGLSLLWALGQGGFRDLNVGLKIWQDFMVPVIELKTYSKYVYEYIHKILFKHKTTKLEILSSDFLTILSSLTTQTKASRDVSKLLEEASKLLVERYVFSAPKTSSTFTTMFKNIPFIAKPELIYFGLILCLIEDPECWTAWRGLYRKNIQQTVELLNHIENSTPVLSLKLINDRLFHQFLDDIQAINVELGQSRKRVEGLKASTTILQQVQEKVASKKNKSAKVAKTRSSGPVRVCCSVVLGTFLLFGLTGALIGFDTLQAGGMFERSNTGQLLKQAGLLPAVEDAWTCTLKHSARGYKWAEENIPIYYQIASKAIGPYIEFSIDFSKILWNGTKKGFASLKLLVEQKSPVVVDFIEQYAPGLPKKIGDFACSTWTTVSTVSVRTFQQGCDFLKAKVFIGQLSPENLGKAFNSTQLAAAQYYSWFYEQVDFYAKIK